MLAPTCTKTPLLFHRLAAASRVLHVGRTNVSGETLVNIDGYIVDAFLPSYQEDDEASSHLCRLLLPASSDLMLSCLACDLPVCYVSVPRFLAPVRKQKSPPVSGSVLSKKNRFYPG